MPAYGNDPAPNVKPAANDFPKKKEQESFNEAANPPNNPTKNHPPTHFNTNYDYCKHDSDDDY